MAKRNNIWANLDWVTIFLYLLLMFMGWINIYAAVYNEEFSSIFDISQRYGKQLLWIGAAIVLAFTMLIIDSNFYVSLGYVLYLVIIFLLITVLLVGTEVNGARSWFQIGGFAIQPAEFAKFTTALALAKYVSSFNFKIHQFKSLLTIGAILLTPVLLIFLQNDTGSALVFSVFVLVLYREGLSGNVLFLGLLLGIVFVVTLVYGLVASIALLAIGGFVVHYFIQQRIVETLKTLAIFLAMISVALLGNFLLKLERSTAEIMLYVSVIGVIVFAIYSFRKKINKLLIVLGVFLSLVFFTFSVDYVVNKVMEPHQRVRINELLGLQSDPHGSGYHVIQSKIAIGSGGFSGKGFLQGTQTKFDFVPEQSTDFIFCTVGEEWGFIGATFVIVIFLFFLLRLIFLAERQRSIFSRVYGYSVACILFFHLAINIGMTIGLAPVIGIPLPFFSYGGSSLWSFTVLLFIFLRLDASRTEKLSY
ncbi:rod shape-determining protein RodA [Sunxiuqinia sp. A32]|uniref:rod shape-determining protein RodA n=1 Tax=Sunxiuqinia sp. A32 TaxID=3461496 RepID=UPI0040452747